MHNKAKAYKEGWSACTIPLVMVRNPYAYPTQESEDWARGYQDHLVMQKVTRIITTYAPNRMSA